MGGEAAKEMEEGDAEVLEKEEGDAEGEEKEEGGTSKLCRQPGC